MDLADMSLVVLISMVLGMGVVKVSRKTFRGLSFAIVCPSTDSCLHFSILCISMWTISLFSAFPRFLALVLYSQ